MEPDRAPVRHDQFTLSLTRQNRSVAALATQADPEPFPRRGRLGPRQNPSRQLLRDPLGGFVHAHSAVYPPTPARAAFASGGLAKELSANALNRHPSIAIPSLDQPAAAAR